MDYKGLIERLKYYGTTYAIGDSLGREIEGSDELMLGAANVIAELVRKVEQFEKQLAKAKLNRPFELSGQGAENFALAAQLSESQQKLKEVTAERDAAIDALDNICSFGDSPCKYCENKAKCLAQNPVERCRDFEWCGKGE